MDFLPEPRRPLTTLVLLRQIRFDTNNRDACKTPAKIEGGVTLTLISEAISRVEGDAFYKFPLAACKQPAVFRIQGKGFLRDLQVADMYAQYVTPQNGDLRWRRGRQHEPDQRRASASTARSTSRRETFFVEGKDSAGTDQRPGRAGRSEHPGKRGAAAAEEGDRRRRA